MPIPNSANTFWIGYLLDGQAGLSAEFLRTLQQILTARSLPKFGMWEVKANMWWRKDSICLDLRSEVDGTFDSTVHVLDYGTALFIGIAFVAVSSVGNYYKRMAAYAFLETIDRCVLQTIAQLTQNEPIKITNLKEIGFGGKFGG